VEVNQSFFRDVLFTSERRKVCRRKSRKGRKKSFLESGRLGWGRGKQRGKGIYIRKKSEARGRKKERNFRTWPESSHILIAERNIKNAEIGNA